MSTKRFKELKSMSTDELKTRLRETEAKLFDARMKKCTGQLSETGMLWRLRKEMAHLKTIQSQNSASKAGK